MLSRLQQWLPWLLTIFIVVAAAVVVTSQSLTFWRNYQQLGATQIASTGQTGQQITRRPVRELVGQNLFGDFTKPAGAKPAQVQEDLPETNLQLLLRGISSSDETSVGGALIEGPDRNTDFFRVGENMPGDATLHSVFANRVVIDRGGQLENLFFPEEAGNSSGVDIYSPAPEDAGADENYDQSQDNYQEEYQDTQQIQEIQEMSEYAPEVGSDQESAQPGETIDSSGYQQAEGIPAPNGQAEVVDGLDEARREEIRERLQKMREAIRNQSQ